MKFFSITAFLMAVILSVTQSQAADEFVLINLSCQQGGGWNDFGRHLRSAYRAAYPPKNRTFNLGFRLARNSD